MPELTEDDVTEMAMEVLARGERLDRGGRYLECPACALWVHHTDQIEHARTCEDLRVVARGATHD